jgi:hypothetical protein
MTTISNETRAERAEAALRGYVEAKGDPYEASSSEVADLIADLLHLAVRLDQGDEPVESTLRVARMHFEAEHQNPEEAEPEFWEKYQEYLEAGDPGIPADQWDAACLTWEEWKERYGDSDAVMAGGGSV